MKSELIPHQYSDSHRSDTDAEQTRRGLPSRIEVGVDRGSKCI